MQFYNRVVLFELVILFQEGYPQEIVRDVGQNLWMKIFVLAVFIISKLEIV